MIVSIYPLLPHAHHFILEVCLQFPHMRIHNSSLFWVPSQHSPTPFLIIITTDFSSPLAKNQLSRVLQEHQSRHPKSNLTPCH